MKPNESFIGQPVRSLQTMLRVLAKHDQRLPMVIPDGIYGPATADAVAAFQRHSGIPVSGSVDQFTWDRIVTAYNIAQVNIGKAESIEILLEPNEVIRSGDSSPYLLLAQAMLLQLSRTYDAISPIEVSGILDTETEDAILAFQKLSSLSETGQLDRVTWHHLSKQFTLHAHQTAKM